MANKKSLAATAALSVNLRLRWRTLSRHKKFRRDLETLNRIYYLTGNVSEEQRESVADKWGIPSIPWTVILYFPPPDHLNDPRWISRTTFLDQLSLSEGDAPFEVSYIPVSVHRVEAERFAFLMIDLYHPINDLIPLVSDEIQKVKNTLPQKKTIQRRHRNKEDLYLKVWDLRQQGLTADEIAPKLWPKEYETKGGRNLHYGDKGPLIQRVYDHELVAQKLIDGIHPRIHFRKIKK